MYIVMLAYTAPREEIDYLLPDHIEWLTRHYDAGHFLCSGRQSGELGRVIITRPMPRGKLEAMLATDPLDLAKMVRHQVVEFEATRTAPELSRVNEALAS
ncbi:YciI family protein [Actinocrispum wychmicini]|nr:YciI family protein [Actinocrispum wychmicini]